MVQSLAEFFAAIFQEHAAGNWTSPASGIPHVDSPFVYTYCKTTGARVYEGNDLGWQHGLLSNLLLLQLAMQVQQAEEAQAMHTKPLTYHCICLLLNHQDKLAC